MTETKGQMTKQHILREGLMLASVKGLVNISIGGLAAKADMSRSGLFAHFLSKEQLQLEILAYADRLFAECIVEPSQQIEDPVEQLLYLVREVPSWYEKIDPSLPGGCIFLIATLEFDDRPGKIRDFLLEQQSRFVELLKGLHRKAVATGQFSGGMDDDQFAFVFYSFYMGYNQYKKFFGNDSAQAHIDRNLYGLIEYAKTAPRLSNSSVN